MNPYNGASFFECFVLFFSRLPSLLMGKATLASDEVQLLALLGLAICSAILGLTLYIKKMTMAAGALSHTILLGIAASFLVLKAILLPAYFVSVHTLPTLVIGGLIAALITLFFNDVLHQKLGVEKGASIGLVFTTLFALSLLIVSLYLKHTHIGLESIMGNIDGLHVDDLKGIGLILILNVGFILLFFRPLVVSAFDPLFGRSVGVRMGLLRWVLMFILAVSATLFFRVVGVFLFLAFLVIPTFIARQWVGRLIPLLFLSCAISIASAFCGVSLSRHLLSYWGLPLSSAALVVVSMFLLAFVLYLFQVGKTMVINRKKRYSENRVLTSNVS